MTSKESMDYYLKVKNEINPVDQELRNIWKTGTQEEKDALCKKSLEWKKDHERRLIEACRSIIPEVGMPCTVCYYTDYHAATVIEILSPRKIRVKDNKTQCIDYWSGKYKIFTELEGAEYTFIKRSNNRWILEGHKSKDGVCLQLHYQLHYIDPSF